MGLEGPAWVAFPVSPSPHPAVLSYFSAAPTVQSKAPFGLWRRWHGEAEVPPLLQQHPVEQAGGLGRLTFPWELGTGPLSLALVTTGSSVSSACWGRFACKGCPGVGHA